MTATPRPAQHAPSNGGDAFDLIVIGAGSGGVAAARRAAGHGARVAIVEGSRVGGTCVIRGCVPKKLLMYAAQYGDALDEAAGYGWHTGETRFEMARWAQAKAAETDRLETVYKQMLASAGVTLVEGWARIEGPGQVLVGERRLRAPRLLIATGAAPVRDSIPGIGACATSDDLLDLQGLPTRAAVIGGGYIGVEFASMLQRLGVAVSVFYRDGLPLRGFDEDLRVRAATALQAAGVELHPRSAPKRIAPYGNGHGDGDGDLLIETHDGRVSSYPWVLNATGRRPNTQGLGLETLGIRPDAKGAIPVDAHLRTTADQVWAVGDVTDRKNLTPVAIAEGRALADALFGPGPRHVDLALVASAVFMLPPMATVGLTEAEVMASGRAAQVFETDFRPMRQAFVGRQERTYMKLLVDEASDRVLGAHMIGTDAPEIVQSLAVALTCGATKADFDRTMAVHPTAAEEFMLMRQPARRIGLAPPPQAT